MKTQYIKAEDDCTTKNINLYHFTNGYAIKNILKYGIIFGDVMTGPAAGFNAPNLTERSDYHIPHAISQDVLDTVKTFRVTVELNRSDKKLVNYADYDKKYANNYHRKTLPYNDDVGYLEEQWLYLGQVKPSTFTDISIWDNNNNKWVSLSTDEVMLMTQSISTENTISLTRLLGSVFNDKTGMVKKYYKENDDLTTGPGEMYVLSDFVIRTLQKNALKSKKHAKRLEDYQLSIVFCQPQTVSAFMRIVVAKYKDIDPHSTKINKFKRYQF
jgi:hypothetical protein